MFAHWVTVLGYSGLEVYGVGYVVLGFELRECEGIVGLSAKSRRFG